MEILKVPDEYDMELYKRKKVHIDPCPYCGNTKHNRTDKRYEFRNNDNIPILWKHDVTIKTRLSEIGLRKVLFRKYHIKYIWVKCFKCGAEWRGDLYDDNGSFGVYDDRYRDDEITEHQLCLFITLFTTGITLLLLFSKVTAIASYGH